MARRKGTSRPLGVHTSIAGGLHLSIVRAHDLGCTTAQIFSHNPRSWKTAAIGPDEVSFLKELRDELDVNPLFIHASYLINIASASDDLAERSAALLEEEMERADAVGAEYVVLHPGSAHDGEGKRRAGRTIREVLKGRGYRAGLLIENTSGKRGDIAPRVADMAEIMETAEGLVRGVCIDTCHAFAAGYDLRKQKTLQGFSDELEGQIGREDVCLIHLNDSKQPMGSGVDRHEHIGEGHIGARALGALLRHPTFRNAPVILETPKHHDEDDRKNLRKTRALLRHN
jgi:deoxyribonuclease-4